MPVNIYDIPVGFLVLIFEFDFSKLYSYCVFLGFNIVFTEFGSHHILMFFSEPELLNAISFCYYHSCLCFVYSLQNI